ncbi:MAG: cytochrome c3 family protein [Bacteroidales bacterium]|nr:cytochrome c3 family protein [Bacteroidales bacterium]
MNKAVTKYLIAFVAIILCNACSPEAGKKTLNFFFDGIPAESQQVLAIATDTLIIIDSLRPTQENFQKAEITYHIPYVGKECASCHDQDFMGKYVLPQPELCYQCHEDFNNRYEVLHGPVAGGYCTNCHHPHFTKEENLLKRTGQELCLYCHIPGKGFNEQIHVGIENTNCIKCHNPHGGKDRLMFN